LRVGVVASVFLAVLSVWLFAQTAQRTTTREGGSGGPIKLNIHQGTMIAIALSPDKRTLVMDLQGSLFTLPASGGHATRITDELFDARQPDWSPAGDRIAFQSNRDGLIHIWTIKPDGSDARQITSGPFEDREPHWSPDGKRIAFSSDRSSNYDIWDVDVQGGALQQLTKNPANDFSPSWSPNGREVAFVSNRQPSPGVYAIDAESKSERLITAVEGAAAGPGPGRIVAGTPAWNPDGKSVVYTSTSAGKPELLLNGKALSSGEDLFPFRAQWLSPTEFLYTADGLIKRRSVTANTVTPVEFTAELTITVPSYTRKRRDFDSTAPRKALGILRPTISPDGKQVAFVAVGDLWLMTIGSKPVRLTNDASAKTDPSWSPDGSKLMYSSDRSGSFNLWMREMKTGQEHQVTDVTSSAAGASFSPDGNRVAYVSSTGDMTGEIDILDLQSKKTRKIHEATFGPGYPSWSSNGKVVIISSLKQDSSRFREGTNQMLALSADGSLPERLIVPSAHHSMGTRLGEGPAFSPDGKQMAFEMEDALWVMSVTPAGDPVGSPRQLIREPIEGLNWTSDSKHIFYQSVDKLMLISTETGQAKEIPLDLTWTQHVPTGRIVIHAGHLVDGLHAASMANIDVVIEGNRIRSVEPHRAALHTGRFVDASNETVMPGLIEAHGHYIDTNGSTFGRLLLAYGITTVRSPGTKPSEGIEQREAFEAGRRPGPRMYLTGQLLEGPRLYYPLGKTINNEAQVDIAIDRAERLQYDLLKTYVKLPEPLRKRAVEGAHRIGIPVSSHEIYPAALFGSDSTEHFTGTAGRGYATKVSSTGRCYQDVLEILAKSGMTITPTLSLGGFYQEIAESDPKAYDDPRWSMQPSWVRAATEGTRRGFGRMQGQLASVLAMEKAGVKIVAGTDAPLVPYGLSLHNDLDQEVRAGLTPFQALQTATVNSAALLNATADIGTIEAGKLADMVVVDGDPLLDILNARKVKRVIKNGEVIELKSLVTPTSTSPVN
jgi:Tol biopolymer transport system component/imidazolonepropionase-like amidohydrolase